MSKQQEHDLHVINLATLLRRSGQYHIIETHVPYYDQAITRGEIDVVAIGYETFDLYEVKVSAMRGNFQEAVRQLRTARNYFSQLGSDFIYTPQHRIESLDAVVQRLNLRMRHKQKQDI